LATAKADTLFVTITTRIPILKLLLIHVTSGMHNFYHTLPLHQSGSGMNTFINYTFLGCISSYHNIIFSI